MSSNIQKLAGISISIIALMVIFYIVPYVGDSTDSITYGNRNVESISVFVLDEGTTATHVTCAIYDETTQRIIAQTEEQLITTDAWNVCSFSVPPKIDVPDQYILVAFADGDIAIPADGTNYISDTGNTYDAFPTVIDYAGTEDSVMSIYAIYE
jgi:hypothetical protein